MKKIFDVRHFIILFLIIAVVLLQSDNHTVIKEVPSKPVHDTIIKEVEVPVKGNENNIDSIIYVPTFIKVDTVNILKEFYTKNSHSDTLKLNNNQGVIYLNQTISENKVISTTFTSKIKEKIVREPAPLPPPIRNQVYIGLNGSFNQQEWLNTLGGSVMLKTKNDRIYSFGLGVMNRTVDGVSGEFTPIFTGGVYWKIKIKKD